MLEPLRLPTLLAFLVSVGGLGCGETAYDLLISGGLVVDGSGSPPKREDLAIRGDRIVARGLLGDARARTTIDATGRIVAPGFIDLLGHTGQHLLVEPSAESKIRQGVTTEITGEGRSLAPQNASTRSELEVFAERHGITVDWSDFDGYFERLAERGSALNLGSYVGATQVRKVVIGRADRPASAAEQARMQRLVREAMQQGAFGLSSALVYAPGAYASTDELVALARVAGTNGGLYATHLRGEGGRVFAALEEAFAIARAADVPVEIFHLKAAGPEMQGRMGELVARIEEARAAGLDVTADVYPYRAAYTSLAATLPPWVHAGGTARLLDRLRDPDTRGRVLSQIAARGDDWENFYRLAGGAEGIQIASVENRALESYRSLRLSEVATQWGLEGPEALVELLLRDGANTSAIYFVSTESDVEHALVQPWVHIATDATAFRNGSAFSEPSLHPRAYGTFPRVLRRYVLDEPVLALEDAIRKMTSAPARRVGLRERGELRIGYYADVVVIDPEAVRDLATYEAPTRYSTGIDYVVVNGELVLAGGRMTEALPGRALRGPGWQPPDARSPGDPLAEPVCSNDSIATPAATWVVVAHPEDVTLGFAGPLYEATQAGRPTRVVILTDGRDDCAACDLWKRGEVTSPTTRAPGCSERELTVFAHVRRREALAALERLGIEAEDVRFFGRTAGTLRAAWADPTSAPRLPACLRERSSREQGETASGERLRRDLIDLTRGLDDDAAVFTTHPYDGDPDHGASYEFVRAALDDADRANDLYVSVLRDNRDEPCKYPNPPAADCEPPSAPEIATSPGLLAARREQRYRPEDAWNAPRDVDYGTPLFACLPDALYRGPEALKRRAIEQHESLIGLRQRRGQPLPKEYQGWLDASGRLLSFVHKNELFYRDEGRFLRGGSRGTRP